MSDQLWAIINTTPMYDWGPLAIVNEIDSETGFAGENFAVYHERDEAVEQLEAHYDHIGEHFDLVKLDVERNVDPEGGEN